MWFTWTVAVYQNNTPVKCVRCTLLRKMLLLRIVKSIEYSFISDIQWFAFTRIFSVMSYPVEQEEMILKESLSFHVGDMN